MNIKFLAISLVLLIVSQISNAQPHSHNINNFLAINILDTSINQYGFLKSYIKDKSIVGLGEASHGTQEFYITKALISKYLISQENFTTLAFEMDEKVAEKINKYVYGEKEDILSVLKQYGLNNSNELMNLFVWIKKFNDVQKDKSKMISIIGFDSQAYWPDPFVRDSLMAQNLISKLNQNKCILWAHNSHLIKSTTWDITNSGIRAMGNYIYDNFKNSYYMIAFDTCMGNLNTVENGDIKSYNFRLEKTLLNQEVSNYFIAFNNNQYKYNITNLSSNLEGNPQLSPSILGLDIDALVFIKETTASKILK